MNEQEQQITTTEVIRRMHNVQTRRGIIDPYTIILFMFMNGYSLIHVAVIFNMPETLQILINKAEDVNKYDFEGLTPLMLCITQMENPNDLRVVNLLLNSDDFEINKRNYAYETAYMLTAAYWPQILELLVQKGADKSAKNIHGRNALFYANDLETAKKLFDLGTPVEKDKYGVSLRQFWINKRLYFYDDFIKHVNENINITLSHKINRGENNIFKNIKKFIGSGGGGEAFGKKKSKKNKRSRKINKLHISK
jgi:hypothetical protein